jgi:hypothetical protein
LLGKVNETPLPEYPSVHTDEVVVWQLGEFREARAVPDLERIAAFAPTEKGTCNTRPRAPIVKLAKEALGKIRGGKPV